MTVTQMIASLTGWLREEVDNSLARDAISDSVLSLWETLVLISISELLGGPVTATFAPASNVNTDSNVPIDIWYIHSMSMPMPDGTSRYWEGTEVGSELWKFFSRSNSAPTPYQPYVYDFNGAQIRIEPTPNQALTPGYFYVKKPVALTDEDMDVDLPFHHPGAETFIRYNSLSLILLANNELQASSVWDSKAEKERLRIVQTSARKVERKNLRVQPIFR